jgi:periplasmic protein TonB
MHTFASTLVETASCHTDGSAPKRLRPRAFQDCHLHDFAASSRARSTMHGILHSLQISTLSAWLSVAGFGTVGIWTHSWQAPASPAAKPVEETEIIPADFLMEAAGAPAQLPPDALRSGGDSALSDPLPETLPAPPELAPPVEMAPLPDVPDLPAPQAANSPQIAPAATADSPTPSTSARTASPNAKSAPGPSRASGSGHRGVRGDASSSTGVGSAGGGARLASGRMPAPAYPSAARRAGQTGSVLVEFTIGTDGRVLSAHAKQPCQWAALNQAAVQAVRRWKFPPGGVMTTQRRLDFVLSH